MEEQYRATRPELIEAFSLWRAKADIEQWDDNDADTEVDADLFIEFLALAKAKLRYSK